MLQIYQGSFQMYGKGCHKFWRMQRALFLLPLFMRVTSSIELLCQLDETFTNGFKSKHPGKLKKEIFHQDNARLHMSLVSTSPVSECDFDLVDYLICFPSMALSNYNLLIIMKKKSTCLGTNISVMMTLHLF